MNVKLGTILAGKGRRTRKPDHHRFIQNLGRLRVAELPQMTPAWSTYAASKPFQCNPAPVPGNTNDTERYGAGA